MNQPFTHKLVAILNEKIETGRAMNALAHMCIGLGSAIGQEPLRLSNYVDADGGEHPFISEMPFMVLKARNANKIRDLRSTALQQGIRCADFTDTMTIGSYVEQLKKTEETPEKDLDYFGIVLFGPWEIVSELTRKFSLWK